MVYSKEYNLGVYMDTKMNWLYHLKDLEDRVVRFQHKLSRVSRVTWGLRSSVAKQIYLGAVEKFIMYASNAWYEDTRR